MNILHCKGELMIYVWYSFLKDKDMASDTKRTNLNYRVDRGAASGYLQ
jgi:hypothetical protein